VRFFLAQIALSSGNLREALDLYEQAVAVETAHQGLPRSGVFVNRLPVVAAWTAICLAESGRFGEAVARGERALRLAENEPFNCVVAQLCIGRVHLERGELSTAVATLNQALHLCRRTNNLLNLVHVMGALGYARAVWGYPAEGLVLLETAVSQASSRRQAVLAPILAWQSEALFLAGRPDEARSVAERALALARDRDESGHEARVLHLLGQFALDREPSDFDAAERQYREALVLATDLGMRPLVAHCHLGLGKLSRRTGKRDQAQEHLTTATTMYREMDMRFYLEQAEAEIREA
jgi:tetratricopeptide (TPR) repeat protein